MLEIRHSQSEILTDNLRPKKNICVFTVTCQKNLGSVGWD